MLRLFTILLLFLGFSSYSQEFISEIQIFSVNDVVTKMDMKYYFNIKDDYVQETNRRRMLVKEIYDLDIPHFNGNIRYEMTRKENVLEYRTLDTISGDTSLMIFILKRLE